MARTARVIWVGVGIVAVTMLYLAVQDKGDPGAPRAVPPRNAHSGHRTAKQDSYDLDNRAAHLGADQSALRAAFDLNVAAPKSALDTGAANNAAAKSALRAGTAALKEALAVGSDNTAAIGEKPALESHVSKAVGAKSAISAANSKQIPNPLLSALSGLGETESQAAPATKANAGAAQAGKSNIEDTPARLEQDSNPLLSALRAFDVSQGKTGLETWSKAGAAVRSEKAAVQQKIAAIRAARASSRAALQGGERH